MLNVEVADGTAPKSQELLRHLEVRYPNIYNRRKERRARQEALRLPDKDDLDIGAENGEDGDNSRRHSLTGERKRRQSKDLEERWDRQFVEEDSERRFSLAELRNKFDHNPRVPKLKLEQRRNTSPDVKSEHKPTDLREKLQHNLERLNDLLYNQSPFSPRTLDSSNHSKESNSLPNGIIRKENGISNRSNFALYRSQDRSEREIDSDSLFNSRWKRNSHSTPVFRSDVSMPLIVASPIQSPQSQTDSAIDVETVSAQSEASFDQNGDESRIPDPFSAEETASGRELSPLESLSHDSRNRHLHSLPNFVGDLAIRSLLSFHTDKEASSGDDLDPKSPDTSLSPLSLSPLVSPKRYTLQGQTTHKRSGPIRADHTLYSDRELEEIHLRTQCLSNSKVVPESTVNENGLFKNSVEIDIKPNSHKKSIDDSHEEDESLTTECKTDTSDSICDQRTNSDDDVDFVRTNNCSSKGAENPQQDNNLRDSINNRSFEDPDEVDIVRTQRFSIKNGNNRQEGNIFLRDQIKRSFEDPEEIDIVRTHKLSTKNGENSQEGNIFLRDQIKRSFEDPEDEDVDDTAPSEETAPAKVLVKATERAKRPGKQRFLVRNCTSDSPQYGRVTPVSAINDSDLASSDRDILVDMRFTASSDDSILSKRSELEFHQQHSWNDNHSEISTKNDKESDGENETVKPKSLKSQSLTNVFEGEVKVIQNGGVHLPSESVKDEYCSSTDSPIRSQSNISFENFTLKPTGESAEEKFSIVMGRIGESKTEDCIEDQSESAIDLSHDSHSHSSLNTESQSESTEDKSSQTSALSPESPQTESKHSKNNSPKSYCTQLTMFPKHVEKDVMTNDIFDQKSESVESKSKDSDVTTAMYSEMDVAKITIIENDSDSALDSNAMRPDHGSVTNENEQLDQSFSSKSSDCDAEFFMEAEFLDSAMKPKKSRFQKFFGVKKGRYNPATQDVPSSKDTSSKPEKTSSKKSKSVPSHEISGKSRDVQKQKKTSKDLKEIQKEKQRDSKSHKPIKVQQEDSAKDVKFSFPDHVGDSVGSFSGRLPRHKLSVYEASVLCDRRAGKMLLKDQQENRVHARPVMISSGKGTCLDLEKPLTSPRLEIEDVVPATRNDETEPRNVEIETRNGHIETRNGDIKTGNGDIETRNADIETRNFEIKTRNGAVKTGMEDEIDDVFEKTDETSADSPALKLNTSTSADHQSSPSSQSLNCLEPSDSSAVHTILSEGFEYHDSFETRFHQESILSQNDLSESANASNSPRSVWSECESLKKVDQSFEDDFDSSFTPRSSEPPQSAREEEECEHKDEKEKSSGYGSENSRQTSETKEDSEDKEKTRELTSADVDRIFELATDPPSFGDDSDADDFEDMSKSFEEHSDSFDRSNTSLEPVKSKFDDDIENLKSDLSLNHEQSHSENEIVEAEFHSSPTRHCPVPRIPEIAEMSESSSPSRKTRDTSVPKPVYSSHSPRIATGKSKYSKSNDDISSLCSDDVDYNTDSCSASAAESEVIRSAFDFLGSSSSDVETVHSARDTLRRLEEEEESEDDDLASSIKIFSDLRKSLISENPDLFAEVLQDGEGASEKPPSPPAISEDEDSSFQIDPRPAGVHSEITVDIHHSNVEDLDEDSDVDVPVEVLEDHHISGGGSPAKLNSNVHSLTGTVPDQSQGDQTPSGENVLCPEQGDDGERTPQVEDLREHPLNRTFTVSTANCDNDSQGKETPTGTDVSEKQLLDELHLPLWDEDEFSSDTPRNESHRVHDSFDSNSDTPQSSVRKLTPTISAGSSIETKDPLTVIREQYSDRPSGPRYIKKSQMDKKKYLRRQKEINPEDDPEDSDDSIGGNSLQDPHDKASYSDEEKDGARLNAYANVDKCDQVDDLDRDRLSFHSDPEMDHPARTNRLDSSRLSGQDIPTSPDISDVSHSSRSFNSSFHRLSGGSDSIHEFRLNSSNSAREFPLDTSDDVANSLSQSDLPDASVNLSDEFNMSASSEEVWFDDLNRSLNNIKLKYDKVDVFSPRAHAYRKASEGEDNSSPRSPRQEVPAYEIPYAHGKKSDDDEKTSPRVPAYEIPYAHEKITDKETSSTQVPRYEVPYAHEKTTQDKENRSNQVPRYEVPYAHENTTQDNESQSTQVPAYEIPYAPGEIRDDNVNSSQPNSGYEIPLVRRKTTEDSMSASLIDQSHNLPDVVQSQDLSSVTELSEEKLPIDGKQDDPYSRISEEDSSKDSVFFNSFISPYATTSLSKISSTPISINHAAAEMKCDGIEPVYDPYATINSLRGDNSVISQSKGDNSDSDRRRSNVSMVSDISPYATVKDYTAQELNEGVLLTSKDVLVDKSENVSRSLDVDRSRFWEKRTIPEIRIQCPTDHEDEVDDDSKPNISVSDLYSKVMKAQAKGAYPEVGVEYSLAKGENSIENIDQELQGACGGCEEFVDTEDEGPPLPQRKYNRSISNQSNYTTHRELSASRSSLFTNFRGKMRKAMSMDRGLDVAEQERKKSEKKETKEKNKKEKKDKKKKKEEKMSKAPSLKSLSSIFGIKSRDRRSTVEVEEKQDQPEKKEKKERHSIFSRSKKKRFVTVPIDIVETPTHFRCIGKLRAVNPDGTQIVEMTKPPEGPIGFYIAKGTVNYDYGIIVSRFKQDQQKLFAGILGVGDEILEINDTSVKHMTVDEVHALMEQTDTLLMKVFPITARKEV